MRCGTPGGWASCWPERSALLLCGLALEPELLAPVVVLLHRHPRVLVAVLGRRAEDVHQRVLDPPAEPVEDRVAVFTGDLGHAGEPFEVVGPAAGASPGRSFSGR